MAVTASPFWDQGTATLANGSATVTGQGTNWLTALLRPLDQIESADGRRATILSINSATSITLDRPWQGGSQTAGAYKIWRTPDEVIFQARVQQLVAALGTGNIEALAGLTGAANLLAYFTGSGAMATTSLTALGRTLLGRSTSADMRSDIGANSATNLNTGTLPDARISATLTPDKAFRRGNIIGTVSQSSGAPTGAIIERDSNANGQYVRFADGTQLCVGVPVTPSAGPTTASGSLFLGPLTLWTFPVSFASPPYINQSSGNSGRLAGSASPNTTGVNLREWSGVSSATAVAMTGFAVGRWF